MEYRINEKVIVNRHGRRERGQVVAIHGAYRGLPTIYIIRFADGHEEKRDAAGME
jgi:hypothetical protein